jgi:hypothetical protein
MIKITKNFPIKIAGKARWKAAEKSSFFSTFSQEKLENFTMKIPSIFPMKFSIFIF